MGARAKTRIYATPKFSEQTRFASDRFIATYFQALMAFDAGSGELSWARAVPADIVGADAASSGFVVCLINGKVLRFDAEGGDAGSLDLGTHLRGCVVDAGTLNIAKGEALPAKAAQLSTAITTLGPDMATAQLFLLAEIGKLEDASVTKTLIEVSMSSRMAPSVRNEARRLLATRKSGAEFMLAALEAPFDFMSANKLPAPVGPLADALAAMGERRAAPCSRSTSTIQRPRSRRRARRQGAERAGDDGRAALAPHPSPCTAPPRTIRRSCRPSCPSPKPSSRSAALTAAPSSSAPRKTR